MSRGRGGPSPLRLVALGVLLGLSVARLFPGEEPSGAPDPLGDVAGKAVEPARAQQNSPGMPGPEDELTDKERQVLTELQQRRQKLEEERARLDKKRQRLQILKSKLGDDLDRLKRYRDQLTTKMNQEKQLRTEKMNHLVKVYSSMEPEKAAERINEMSRETAVKLLSRMSGQAAGRILGFVAPDKANAISQEMAKPVAEIGQEE
jgi:flagellar motility protein MotE (MotC chaperone)